MSHPGARGAQNSGQYIGKSIGRSEDRRFLTGRGQYVDDITPRDAAYGVFLRSPHAHARILDIDAAAAEQLPGVVRILLGRDWISDSRGAFVVASPVTSSDGVERQQLTQPVLANSKVCYVGQPVALVVAETIWQAQEAAEAIAVEYEPLPSVTETARALDADTPVIHDDVTDSNLVFVRDIGDLAAVDAAFAKAAHVTSITLTNNRITANPIEPRSALGVYDPGTDQFTLWATHQAPHILRRDLAENTLRHPEHKIRVVAPDVGGGFGMKVANHPEDPAVLWAAKICGRPVKWTATRSESLLSDAQARDHYTQARMAFDLDGRILAVHVDTIASLGAFQTRLGASIPSNFYARMLVGLYTVPAAYVRVRGVHTNASPIQAYRGAGRPEATYVLETLVENGAHELGVDACLLRERNFIKAENFPHRIPLGLTYDSANPLGLQDKAKTLFGYDAMRQMQKEQRARGLLIGIGGSAFMDCVGTPSVDMLKMGRKKVGGWDSATLRVHPSGKVTVLAGSHSHGQGHATTFAQIVAEILHCPIENIEIVYGDTDRVQFGHGTWGSRSTVTTGLAVAKAARGVIEKCRAIAAHLLECSPADITVGIDEFRVTGSDRLLSFQDIVDAAYQGGGLPSGLDPALEQVAYFDPTDRSYSSGYHFCAVSIDPETWRVSIVRYTAIDDCGRIINPMIVEGQAHGGIAQGVGQALMENIAFDHDTGQVLSGSFMDYAMPRASDFPFFDTGVQETLADSNELGVRPAGESGTIGALAAVRNAVVDALRSYGVNHIAMPMTPSQIWQAVSAARAVK